MNRHITHVTAAIAICTMLVVPAHAQPTFSVDYNGPMAGGGFPPAATLDAFGAVPITEGDILVPSTGGPPMGVPIPTAPVPGIAIPAPGLGIIPPPMGPFGTIAGGEVDALSYGRDAIHGQLFFSVDEWAIGLTTAAPDVFTEGPTGSLEASADIFTYLGVATPTPISPVAPPVLGNTQFLDGDGFVPTGIPGTGLFEPNPPAAGPADPGDNLDAVDINTTLADLGGPVFFSMDSAVVFDGIETVGGTGTAASNMDVNTGAPFFAGDVVVTTPAGPALYAPAPALGLDIAVGPDTDDLDALVLVDDGLMVIPPAGVVPQNVFSPGSDAILFSVKRGSAVIGMPDSLFGAPIEEGDILTIPFTGPTAASPFPAIVIPAESMGLATVRSGTGTTWGTVMAPLINPAYGVDIWADDLDALDVVPEPASLVLLALGGAITFHRRRKA